MVMRVAVIGAGAAGVCALKHLTARPNQFVAVGFEQLGRVGGTWIYTEKVGLDDHGLPIQSSMYKNLKTNLPKEVMAYPGFPFPKHLPSFIVHEDVLQYLEDYAKHYDIEKFIKFNTCVSGVEPVDPDNRQTTWKVSYYPVSAKQDQESQVFDAVIVCNGHYAVPLVPDLPGMGIFQGTIIHSHNYRLPDPYRDQTVVCLGAAASGQDLSLDLATVAKRVILSHNKPRLVTPFPQNVSQQTGIERLTKDSVVFLNGEEEKIDTLMLCTGYRYKFPFLSESCDIHIEDERVTPLYKHIIHTKFPTLSFIGICKVVCPFPQFDQQVQLVLASLDGTLKLPDQDDMDRDIQEDYKRRLAEGLPHRYAHTMGTRQWEYNDSLAKIGHYEPIPRAIQVLYDYVHETRVNDLPNYKKRVYELTEDDSFKIIAQ